MNKIITFLVLVLVILTALFVWMLKRPVSWNQATSQHFKLAISYPSNWRQSEDEVLFSLVDTKSKSKNFKSYIRISEQDNVDNLFGKVYALAPGSEIAEFSEKSQVTNRTAIKGDYRMVDGQTAFDVAEDTLMPGPYHSEAIYTLRGDKIYIFRLTAESPEELEREKPTFFGILPTVHFN